MMIAYSFLECSEMLVNYWTIMHFNIKSTTTKYDSSEIILKQMFLNELIFDNNFDQ